MTNEYLEKLRSINVGRRTRDRVEEGYTPDGQRYKAVTNEFNATVTERSNPGTGVSQHQDVHLRPETVRWKNGEVQ